MHRRSSLVVAALLVGTTVVADQDRQRLMLFRGSNVVIPVRPRPSNADPTNPAGPRDVITQRNNNLRTGTVVQAGMNRGSVSDGRFGFVAKLDVEGVVLAQPLYMESVDVAAGRRSVVFIATTMNWVYAFNADPPFNQLWKRHLGPPFRIDDPWSAEHLKDCTVQMTTTEEVDQRPLPQQFVVIGIESTPAIDPGLGRLIVSYRTAAGAPAGKQRVAAIDIRTGHLAKGPDGRDLDRPVTDNPRWNYLHRNRASVLIEKGTIYLAYSARCEGFGHDFHRSYQGWVYAFDVRTLAFAGRYRTTQRPDGLPPPEPSDDPVDGGGIWQGSTGLAADGNGSLFFATGNARKGLRAPDPAGKNLSSSVIRLRVDRPSPQRPAITMTAADWFTPYRKLWQDRIDLDFGSAGVVLIPNTRYMVIGGKEGMMYLLNRNDLGKFDEKRTDTTAAFDPDSVIEHNVTVEDPAGRDDPDRDRVAQKFRVGINQYCASRRKERYCFRDKKDGEPPRNPNAAMTGVTMDEWIAWPHIHGSPVFGAFNDGRAFLYIWPEKDHLKSYQWWGSSFATAPTLGTALNRQQRVLTPPYLQDQIGAVGMPGGMLSLTIDPSRPADGVLFASVQRCMVNRDDPTDHECSPSRCDSRSNCREQRFGMLRAFDAITLDELWNSRRDPFASPEMKKFWFSKFVPPTLAKGRVFLATASNMVLVYGRH